MMAATAGIDRATTRSSTRGRAKTDGAFRDDIQALRALAVAAVLLYHLWPNRVTGGFVGVDVFFVISGFLITSHLLDEIRRTGRLGLARFWARRAKRLLPASLLVLAVTAAGILLWVPQTSWPQYLREVIASILYVQNWFLAFSSVDYLAADNTESPVQHFWTLSAEEQFYIALPLVLLVVIAATRRRSTRATVAGIAIAIGAITIASFIYSVVYTSAAPGPAYFSTLTRAWEFGVGALVAMIPAGVPVLRRFAPLAGVALIVLAISSFDEGTVFPGAAAAIPVVGAALVAWSGRGSAVASIGRIRPVAWLGRISYAVYLWHWPLIILLPHLTGRPLSTPDKVAILIATLAVAWASTVHWEDRIRFSPRLLGAATPRRVAWVTAGAMVLTAALPVAGLVSDAQARARNAALIADIERNPPACFGAETLTDSCDNPELADVIIPAPENARDDDVNRSECWSRGTDPTLNICELGPETGYERHLLAIGDSHNNALIAAYERIARDSNWRIDVAGRAGCYWTTADLKQPTDELADVCRQWRSQVTAAIGEGTDYDAVLVTKERKPHAEEVVPMSGQSARDAAVDGMVDAWRTAAERGIPVLAITDNPRLDFDVLACVEGQREGARTGCFSPVEAAYAFPDGMDEAVARADNARLVSTEQFFCTDVCSAVVGGALVYRDNRGHVTATYARTLAPALGEAIAAALREG